MKTKYLIHVLLGGFLALHVCPKSTAQSGFTVLGVADTFEFAANEGNGITSDGTLLTWHAGGYVESPFDGSSMYGSVNLLGGGSIFTGSGNMGITAGSFFDPGTQMSVPSVSVEGVEAIGILFQVTGVVNYRLVSSVSANGNVDGSVQWVGHVNTGGTVMDSGTLLAPVGRTAEFEFGVSMGTGPGITSGNGSWSFSLSLIPADIKPGKLTAAQKADFYEQGAGTQLLEEQLFAGAGESGRDRNLQAALLSAALSIAKFENVLNKAYLDPADTNYTVLAQVVAPAVMPLAASGDITRSEADAYNLWQTNLSQSAGYGTALTTSLDREQGAATAGSAYWATTQMNAAVQFEAQLAALLDHEPALRSNVVAQFQAGAFPAITVTTNDAINLQLQMITNGLPADLLDALTALGVDPDTITNIQYTLLTADPGSMTGGFPGGLVNTNLDSAAHTLAAGLRDASLMLINTSVLPGGQFRFDLPTVPGYTYTVQFSENMADPAGWTTLFTTNATTPLLSFTNTPAAGAQAGFYRASHN